MWFESASKIAEIAKKTSTSIFVVPDKTPIKIPGAITIAPTDKPTITFDQIRSHLSSLGLKQYTDRYIIIRPADKLTIEAANALLKNLEEPKDKVHFLLVTNHPATLPQTILSRAAIYYLKSKTPFTTEIIATDKQKDLAKRLISARPTDIVDIADKLAKRKDKKLAAEDLLGLTIEMLYKSYFITGKDIFIRKLPKFLQAYDSINKNGHVKLQIVANLC